MLIYFIKCAIRYNLVPGGTEAKPLTIIVVKILSITIGESLTRPGGYDPIFKLNSFY